jgi:HlyD family secretion protein
MVAARSQTPEESPLTDERPRRRSRKGWVLACAALVLAGGGVVYWRHEVAVANAQPKFLTTSVDRGRIVGRVTATGTVSALVTVQVGSQVSGRIQALYADFNSPVKKGQLIAKIDPQLFDASVEQARANTVAAKGNLEKAKVQALDAKRQYTRNQQLAERKLIAQADLDTAQANAEAADAQVVAADGALAQARANEHQADVNLAYTKIISPTDGTVISRNVDVGQTVAAALQAPTLFTIAQDLSKMQIDTSVAEADVGKLTAKMKATFTVDAYPNERFTGTVREVRNAPQTVQNVVTYDAVIDVDNKELKLKPGMTANVTFVYADREDVLRVPNAALRFRPPPELMAKLHPAGAPGSASAGADAKAAWRAKKAAGGDKAETPDRKTLWVLSPTGEPKPLPIRTGISDGTTTEIASGEVTPGTQVITDLSDAAKASGPPGGQPTFRRMF